MKRALFTLQELSDFVGAILVGDPEAEIYGLASLELASKSDLAHFSHPKYRSLLTNTLAGAVILRKGDTKLWIGNALVVKDPYLAFARISHLFFQNTEIPIGIDIAARVASTADIHESVSIGPGAVIGERCLLAEGVQVHANCVIGDDAVVGAHSVLKANAVLYSQVRIGESCVVHSNSVIGADGFGFVRNHEGHLESIAQIGGVTIGNRVSIGAGTTIDRGTLHETVVGDGVKIDNQVQIGHNCRIGEHTVICGCVGIAGSVTIGRHCVIAGACGIGGSGPLEIVDNVTITAGTNVLTSVEEPGAYSGGTFHAKTTLWKRNATRFRSLDLISKRITVLERQIRKWNEKTWK